MQILVALANLICIHISLMESTKMLELCILMLRIRRSNTNNSLKTLGTNILLRLMDVPC